VSTDARQNVESFPYDVTSLNSSISLFYTRKNALTGMTNVVNVQE